MPGNYKHGHALSTGATKEYRAWSDMKRRCYDPNNRRYAAYGGRGILVCEQWKESFETFLTDLGLSPSKEHSIERINRDGNYSRENCRWATRIEQARNTTRNHYIAFKGRTQTLIEWSEELHISYAMLKRRINALGWSVEKAFTEPFAPHVHPPIAFNGKTQVLKEWAKELGLSYAMLNDRIRVRGWSVDRAFTTPSKVNQYK